MKRTVLGLSLLLAACQKAPPPGPTAATASGKTSASPAGSVPPGQGLRVVAALRAEGRRDAAAIKEPELGAPDLGTRRAVARALARTGGEDARNKLLRLVADDDPETLSYVAFGLGQACKGAEDKVVAALAARSAGLPAGTTSWDVEAAFARALGKCGTKEAEQLLAAWLRGPRERGRAAALGLGDLAAGHGLSSDTEVALLGQASAFGEALFAFTRRDAEGAARKRLLEVATARLARADENRVFALRALGRVGDEAVPELGRALADRSFTAEERSEAARSLGRVGLAGQMALLDALADLLPASDPASLSTLGGAPYAPLASALEALRPPEGAKGKASLRAVAALAPPTDATPKVVARRLAALRCRAATLLAASHADPGLAACEGEARELATLSVLLRAPLKKKAEKAALRALLDTKSPKVRQQVFEALPSHPELDDLAPAVKEALASDDPARIVAAAECVAKRPALADGTVPNVVTSQLKKAWAKDDVEVLIALTAAAGSVGAKDAKDTILGFCKGPNPTLRAHAARSLDRLGDKQTCTDVVPYAEPNEETGRAGGETTLVLDTDVGELTMKLDPRAAPAAATRLLELAKEGFYDGLAVHRVVPGFVVQFGDKRGDGTGGAGKEPLHCETGPQPFAPLSIGVAIAGRDTGSSQFFVTLSRVPHLDGEYTWLGTAGGDWSAVAEGDRIVSIKVK